MRRLLALVASVAVIAVACRAPEPAKGATGTGARNAPVPVSAASGGPATVATPSPGPLPVPTPQPGLELGAIHMLDAQDGWAITACSILRTQDGGMSWSDATPRVPISDSLRIIYGRPANVAFWDAQTAWVAIRQPKGRITVFRTTDGGQRWLPSTVDTCSTMDFPIAGSPLVLSLTFVDALHGWLLDSCTGGGLGSQDVGVSCTVDGGVTWTFLAACPAGWTSPGELTSVGSKNGLSFADLRHGWLTGEVMGPEIFLQRTTDGGETWYDQQVPVPAGLPTSGTTRPPLFFGAQDGVLPVTFASDRQPTVFYVTHDGGESWKPAPALDLSAPGFLVWSWPDMQHGFVTDGEKLYVTRDAAQSWVAVAPSVPLSGTTQLEFVTEQIGWALREGHLLKTADGGHTWQALEPKLQGPG